MKMFSKYMYLSVQKISSSGDVQYKARGPSTGTSTRSSLIDHPEEDDALGNIITSPRPVAGPGASAERHLRYIPVNLSGYRPSSGPLHQRSNAPRSLEGWRPHRLILRLSAGVDLAQLASDDPHLHSIRHIFNSDDIYKKKHIYENTKNLYMTKT